MRRVEIGFGEAEEEGAERRRREFRGSKARILE